MTRMILNRSWLIPAAMPVLLVLAGCTAQNDGNAASEAAAGSTTADAASTEPIAEADLPPLPSERLPEPAPTSDAAPVPQGETVALAGAAAKAGEPAGSTPVVKDVTTGDWPMWGGSNDRNMVDETTNIDAGFQPGTEPGEGTNQEWVARLGSQTYGNPVVAEGVVVVGTNNGAVPVYRPQHEGDRGVVLCFSDKDGSFLWQLTREKLPQSKAYDWPEQGICSTSCIEDGRLYVVTNRCELICLDVEGFHDGENDGPYQDEVDKEKEDADILWVIDMMGELGVVPHNLATSSPAVLGDNVYIVTSNGVDEAHLEIPAPRAPSFICVNKLTGELVWESNEPFDKILHGQWSSPGIGEVNGQAQVYFPGGDGWLYAFDPAGDGQGGGKLLWKFDMNPKTSEWVLGGRGDRNNVIATPVFYENSVILAVGQDPEHGEGVGHLYRIDATKEGDVSPQIEDGSGGWKDNPNSALIWHHGGTDTDGSITGRKGGLLFRRTISTVAVADGLVIAADLSGFVHCLDFVSGKRNWEYDTFAAIWGSPMVVDGKIFIGDEDGEMAVLELSKGTDGEANEIEVKEFPSSIYSTPTIANGKMYISDRSHLYCFKLK